MACFLVPAVEAAVVTIASKIAKKKDKVDTTADVSLEGHTAQTEKKSGFSRKLAWLKNMLWGGSALLAFEHLWHGEISPFFPFLTAASNAEDTAVMLHEMATVGVAMAVLVTAVWGVMVVVSSAVEKRAESGKSADEVKEGA